MDETDECGFLWGPHECTAAPGHDGNHTCAVHYERCCTDCAEQWTNDCGAIRPREAVAP